MTHCTPFPTQVTTNRYIPLHTVTQVTANRILAMALNASTDDPAYSAADDDPASNVLARLFSGRVTLTQPHLLSAPWPALSVRAARYLSDEKVLWLRVSAAGAAAVSNATLRVALGAARVQDVAVDAAGPLSWAELDGVLEINLAGVNGTVSVEVRMS